MDLFKKYINKNKRMYLKNLFSGIFVAIFLSGCSNTIFKKDEVEVEFIYGSSLVKSSIKLKNNGTFCYIHNAESSETITNGNWIQKNNNVIILNSYNDYLTDTIIVKEINKIKSDIVTLKVFDFYYNKPSDYAILKLNDNDSILQMDNNGKIKFKKPKDFKLLNISTFRKSYTYHVKDTNARTFEVNLYENSNYEFFNNELVEIKNRKLIRKKDMIYKKM
jgi:hypothetical protein